MNSLLHRLLALAAGLCLLIPAAVLASPGAHGPNGEHLDGPAAQAAGSGLPRFEAHSELFEIVGRLEPQGLVLYVSRYETNEAVHAARVEVELGVSKATAGFQAEAGTYVLSDKKLLAALNAAGKHALVFTVTAGTESDLLDGTLAVTPHADTGHAAPAGTGLRTGVALAGGAGLLALVAVALRRRNNKRNAYGAAR